MTVNQKMVSIARESRGLNQAELASRIGVPESSLSRIEFGTLGIKDDMLEKMCAELKYPKEFFFQNFSIYPPNIHYRKRVTLSPKIVRKADALMNIYRSNIEKILQTISLETANLPIIDDEKYSSPRQVAAYLRSYWKIEKGPIKDLVTLVEKHGVIVFMFDYETDKIDGRSMITEYGHPIIFLNKNFSGDRQRMTLAHELGHIMMHLRTIPTFGRDEEAEAFEFAAEFLMPEAEIKYNLPPRLSIELLADLKRIWKVSMAAILYWAEKLGRITPNHSRYIWTQLSGRGYKKNEPIIVELDQPTLVKRMLNMFMEDKQFSKNEIAEIFCLTKEELEQKYFSTVRSLRVA
jgi:Zn-dependent peptidase ImmA (M78 family)/DNA-binding Xre family transcriptional regulator